MIPELPVWLQDVNGLAALVSAIAALVAAVRASRAARDAGKTAAQVAPNGGSSMRDSVTRTEADVAVIRASLEALTDAHRSHGHQLGEVRRDLTAAVDRHEADVRRIDRALDRQSRRPSDPCP